MSQATSSPQSCCTPCTSPLIENIPGTAGAAGASGVDGLDGVSSFTRTTAAFTVPAELGTVTIAVANSLWMVVGLPLYILGAGTFQVTAIPNSVSVTVRNLANVATNAYQGNAVPTTVIASNAGVAPTGLQGSSGDTSTNGGVLSGAGLPTVILSGGLPPTTSGSWVYRDITNKGTYYWNNSLLIWE